MNALHEDLERTEREIALAERTAQELKVAPAPARFPTSPLGPREQPDFLNTLRAYADATRVRLDRWTNATPIAPTSSAQEQEPSTRPKLPAGVAPVSSAVEASGSYANVREFLYLLLRSPRLFTMNDVRWERGDKWPRTRVSFTLTRYVSTAPPAPEESAAAGSISFPVGGGVNRLGGLPSQRRGESSADGTPLVSRAWGCGIERWSGDDREACT